MAEHSSFETEHRVVWPDGSVHWSADRGVFQYEPDGLCTRMLGIFMDITERQQAEQARQDLNTTLENKVARQAAELEHRDCFVGFTGEQ